MRQRVCCRHVGQFGSCATPERSPARGQHELADLRLPASAQALGECRVLGVDRHDLPGLGSSQDQRPADDQGLLVGQRQRRTGGQGSQCRPQAHRAGDGVEHDVALQRGDLLGRVRSDDDARQRELAVLIAATLGLGVQSQLDVLCRGALWRRQRPPTANSIACVARSAGSLPPAASAITRNWSGVLLITSRAWTPTEPVDPRMTTVRGATTRGRARSAPSRVRRSSPPSRTSHPRVRLHFASRRRRASGRRDSSARHRR